MFHSYVSYVSLPEAGGEMRGMVSTCFNLPQGHMLRNARVVSRNDACGKRRKSDSDWRKKGPSSAESPRSSNTCPTFPLI